MVSEVAGAGRTLKSMELWEQARRTETNGEEVAGADIAMMQVVVVVERIKVIHAGWI